MKGLLFGNVASGSLYPRSGLPSSANSGGPGTVVLLAESGWNWQRWKVPFIVIHTSRAWQYLWAPSGSVIFLTLSLRVAGKRWKRPSPRVSLNFLGEWTDVGQSTIYFEQETKVLLKRRVPCWVYWNSPVVYNIHCNPLARAIPQPPSQGGRPSDPVSSPLEETFRAPIACWIKSNSVLRNPDRVLTEASLTLSSNSHSTSRFVHVWLYAQNVFSSLVYLENFGATFKTIRELCKSSVGLSIPKWITSVTQHYIHQLPLLDGTK